MYGKKHVWETNQQGAVGRFHTNDFKNLLAEVPGDITIFKEAYTKRKKLSGAVRHYVNALFGNEGLVVVDGDDHALKKLFIPAIEGDLFGQLNKPLVDQTDKALAAIGYKTQIHCREINLFYLEDGLRSRIEKTGNKFTVVDSDISFTESWLRVGSEIPKIQSECGVFPLYQEMIYPTSPMGHSCRTCLLAPTQSIFDSHKLLSCAHAEELFLVMDALLARKLIKQTKYRRTLPKDKLFNRWCLKHLLLT